MENSITPEAALKLLDEKDSKCLLVDVRSASEFNSLHAAHAIHIPLDQLSLAHNIEKIKDRKIICICQSGMRGEKARQALRSLGFEFASNVEGGTLAWDKAKLPIIKGEGGVSLERQVRIAAGAFVLLGSLAAIYLSPYFLAIPLFVGAGLVFSGITNTCGLALALGKCPWNA